MEANIYIHTNKNIKRCPHEQRIVKINIYVVLDLTNKAMGLGAIYNDERRVLGATEWWNLSISINVKMLKLFYLGLD